jgi:hypothetical protein
MSAWSGGSPEQDGAASECSKTIAVTSPTVTTPSQLKSSRSGVGVPVGVGELVGVEVGVLVSVGGGVAVGVGTSFGVSVVVAAGVRVAVDV